MSTQDAPIRIVVVDDEEVIADTLGLILQERGFEVLVCYDGEHGRLAAQVFNPQILISDVVMPGMNGLELARYYASHNPGCRVLLISGNGATGELAKAAERDGTIPPILPKPMPPTQILEFIDSCINFA